MYLFSRYVRVDEHDAIFTKVKTGVAAVKPEEVPLLARSAINFAFAPSSVKEALYEIFDAKAQSLVFPTRFEFFQVLSSAKTSLKCNAGCPT